MGQKSSVKAIVNTTMPEGDKNARSEIAASSFWVMLGELLPMIITVRSFECMGVGRKS